MSGLITDGGSFDFSTRHYVENIVVFASLTGSLYAPPKTSRPPLNLLRTTENGADVLRLYPAAGHVLPAVSEDEKDEPRHQKYQQDRGDSDPRQP